jgi:hypothetical protein
MQKENDAAWLEEEREVLQESEWVKQATQNGLDRKWD